MSEMSRNARRAMRAKIHRLTSAKSGKVDASDYGPEQVLDSEAKTGMRPISRRAYKKGGKVVAVSGADAKKHAGKKPRAGSKHLTVDALVNRNYKDANEAREGKKHVGALKTGGRANYASGGSTYGDSTPLRLVKSHSGPDGHTAKVYKDKDWDEYRVKHYDENGKYMPKLDYHTSDREEAHDQAQYAVNKGFNSGGRAKKANGGVPDIYTSSRPTDDSGRPISNKELNLGYGKDTPPAPRPAPKATSKPVMRGKPMSVADTLAGSRNMRKHGGKAWEGSAKDEAQDKKLAKKYGMSMSAWEKSKMDKKHDTQHSAKGLNKGGRTGKSLGGVLKDVGKYGALGIAASNPEFLMGGLGALAYDKFLKKKDGAPAAGPEVAGKKRGGRLTSLDGEMQTQEKVGGRIAKRDGGSLAGLEMNSGGRAKKKKSGTNINIVIATGKGQPQMDPNAQQAPSPQGVPVQMPPPPQPQPQAGAPMPMPIPVPMPQAGGPGAGPQPMPRKAGGRTYRSYKDMDAGAGSGLGRLEKTEIQKRKR